MSKKESFGVHVIPGTEKQEKLAALIKEDSKQIFDYEVSEPVKVVGSERGYVPWGESNDQPDQILEKIRKDEVMSSNMFFNINTAYGRGLDIKENGEKIKSPEIKKFFRRNNMIKYWLEQFTDIEHFFFSVLVIILNGEGTKIVKIRHKEAVNCRFESCNPKTGIIENVLFANWQDPGKEDPDVIPLLDEDDPVGDLLIRLGKEPDERTGKKRTPTKERKFAIVNRIPTPGLKYYPFPYYYSTFNSGWYDLKQLIPTAKVAKMTNGMTLKYLVEIHEQYFPKLFKAEGITDPEKKEERKKTEITNIKSFLSGVENQNKSWFTTYYIDPNGKEQRMVRIERIGGEKEGGDYIEDVDEVTSIESYAMGVHTSIIGAAPGKSKNINGTEARELFTMKQALQKAKRDLMLVPFHVINEVNDWDLDFEIPDLMLTTLDEKTDAKVVTQNSEEDDSNNN